VFVRQGARLDLQHLLEQLPRARQVSELSARTRSPE
jgi:hypothetical protein